VPGRRTQIPIFELPLVLLPTEQIPLHIFEERYKAMIRHCLAEEAAFGVVLRTDAGPRLIGCTAIVEDVLEEFEDGRMNILVEGERRFRVTGRAEGAEFPLAEIEPYDDGEPEPGADPGPAVEAFERLLDAVGSDAALDEEAEDSFEIAARVEIPVEEKQSLLEAESEGERLRMLSEILEALRVQVTRSRALAERARGNGHGPISGLGPTER
jgi:Lon protease-like protein